MFALPKDDEPCFKLTATDIFNQLQKRFPAVFRGVNPKYFGKVMTKIGATKTHTISILLIIHNHENAQLNLLVSFQNTFLTLHP
ncbi:MAG: DUF3874 domain-containing protein [Bacteroidaceae bacterium]|nr:DUF3874 domain-containing protein [Bacteroidaceae bacterium]